METKLDSVVQEIRQNIENMIAAGGYGKIEIELKNSQIFIDTTYKEKIDLKVKS